MDCGVVVFFIFLEKNEAKKASFLSSHSVFKGVRNDRTHYRVIDDMWGGPFLPTKRKNMKIAIMGAMPEEVEPIVAKLDNMKMTEYAANTYYEGSYNGQDVVVAYSKIGKVFATLTATMLIEKFGCDTLLFLVWLGLLAMS